MHSDGDLTYQGDTISLNTDLGVLEVDNKQRTVWVEFEGAVDKYGNQKVIKIDHPGGTVYPLIIGKDFHLLAAYNDTVTIYRIDCFGFLKRIAHKSIQTLA
jgi:hypothetical protein